MSELFGAGEYNRKINNTRLVVYELLKKKYVLWKI